MLNISQDVRELFKTGTPHIDYRIEIYNNLEMLLPSDDLYPSDNLYPLSGGEPEWIIENDRLVSESVQIRHSICESDNLVFGKCNAAQLTFRCADATNLKVGDELIVTMYADGNRVEIGSFFVSEITKSADRRFRTVTAYDRMTLFDVDVADWYNGLWENKTSYTLAEFRASLCNYIGVPAVSSTLVNDDMIVTHTIEPSEISGRDVLEAICEINGVFGIINNAGNLQFITLDTTTANETILIGMRRSLDHEDYTVAPIDALVLRQEDNDVGASVGSGTNAYIIQGNFLIYGKSAAQLTNIAANVYNAISGIVYTPVELACRGLPYLVPGDCIDIEMLDGSMIRTIVMSRALSGIQALIDTIKADGTEKREERFGINKSIIQLQGKTNILERTVDYTKSRVEDLEVGYSEIVQTASSLTSRIQNVEGDVSVLEQTASNLSSQISNINDDISYLEQTASSISSRVSNAEGNISSLSQTANSLSARISSAEGDVAEIEATVDGLNLRTYSGETYMSGDRVAVMGEQDAGFRLFSSGSSFSDGNLVGGIRYDTSGAGYDASQRMFVFTQNGRALKLYGDGGVSINAGSYSYVWLYDTIIAPQDTYKPIYMWTANRSLSYYDTFYSSITVDQSTGTITGSDGSYTSVSSAISSGRYYYISGQFYYKYSRTEDGVAKFDTYYIHYSTPKTDVGYSFTNDGMFYSGSLRVPASPVYGSVSVGSGSSSTASFSYAPKAVIVDDGLTHTTGGFGARLLTPIRKYAYIFYTSDTNNIQALMDSSFTTLTVNSGSSTSSTTVYYYAMY